MHAVEFSISLLVPIMALLGSVPVASAARSDIALRDTDRPGHWWSRQADPAAKRRAEVARGTQGGRYLSSAALAAVAFTAERDQPTGCLRYRIRNSTPWRIDRVEILLITRDASGEVVRTEALALPLYEAGWPEAESSNVYPYSQPEIDQSVEVALLSARVDRRFKPEHAMVRAIRPTLFPIGGRRTGDRVH